MPIFGKVHTDIPLLPSSEATRVADTIASEMRLLRKEIKTLADIIAKTSHKPHEEPYTPPAASPRK